MRELLTGWGRTAPSSATVVRPRNEIEVLAELSGLNEAGEKVVARGLGRSYGDAAQNAGGVVFDLTTMNDVVAVDLHAGEVTVAAGISLDTLMRSYLPSGWFVPVTPGTRYVTVGGAIAADIHGKNHHADGSFSAKVRSFNLATASGIVRVSREAHPELFWATVGGMGLTGIITEVTIAMTPVETSSMVVETERAANLDDLMSKMESRDNEFRYSVAWLDCTTQGSSLGRGVLTRGNHALRSDLPSENHDPGAAGRSWHHEDESADILGFDPKTVLKAPKLFPSGLLNPLTVKAFNELWYRKAPKRPRTSVESIASFFHPLDGVDRWNYLYGPKGFLQYQFAIPFGAEDGLRMIVAKLVGSGYASFLAVLKRFGPGNEAPLSFPIAGWTLALDLPAGPAGLSRLLDELDEIVCACEGRVYLAKDSRLRPELMESMYPRLSQWRDTVRTYDPYGVFCSDLSRRLDLRGDKALSRQAREIVDD